MVGLRTSLAVQRIGLRASAAGGTGSIPGWGTEIPHATWCGQKKKKFIKQGLCSVPDVSHQLPVLLDPRVKCSLPLLPSTRLLCYLYLF